MPEIMNQRILGALLVAVSILSVVLLKDATFAILILPLGIYALVTKKYILYDRDFYDNDNEEDDFK